MAMRLPSVSAAVHKLDDSNAPFAWEVEWKMMAFEYPQPLRKILMADRQSRSISSNAALAQRASAEMAVCSMESPASPRIRSAATKPVR